jgi:hypothetical protein
MHGHHHREYYGKSQLKKNTQTTEELELTSSGSCAPMASIVEQGQQAYGKHTLDGEDSIPPDLLNKFLKVQNGTDIRGVAIDGTRWLWFVCYHAFTNVLLILQVSITIGTKICKACNR